MIVFTITNRLPELGDNIRYNNKCYQLIEQPKDSGMQGGLLAARGRYTDETGWHEKSFFFDVEGVGYPK